LLRFNREMRDADDFTPLRTAHVNKQNFPYFHEVCRAYALAQLPKTLTDFCSLPKATLADPWFFEGMEGALLRAMEAHSNTVKKAIAMTCVTREVYDALDFARGERCMVEITGGSRFGKSESARTYCAAHPGKGRLVKVPCDNSDRGLLEAIAAAFGLDVPLRMTLRELKSAVECVTRSQITLVFDEAHYLLPQRWSNHTIPNRLNYVRGLLDNGCPVALLNTPQFAAHAANRFENKTGWNFTQWRARIMRKVALPETLPTGDMLAVVKTHFPQLPDYLALLIVGTAKACGSFLFAVEAIAKNARGVARKNGREEITEEDIDAGIRLAGFSAEPAPAK
jgi:hypothetical protein